MKHLGDITKISGHSAPIVDIVVGGSPCQDLSVAGKRAGLAGARSGLFMEQIRIIKEMRDEFCKIHMRESNEFRGFIKPRYMVWENVPGAFSSNGGEDFRAVLEETARIADKDAVIPRLEGGRSGLLPGAYWEMGGPLLGVYTMHSFGECPREERESRLSQILEDSAHPKYYLSTKACQGILNRAKRRGKTLPEALRIALEKQSAFKSELDALNTIDRPAIAYSQDAYDKYTESNQSATIKQSGGVYGGGSESIVIQSERSADATTKE